MNINEEKEKNENGITPSRLGCLGLIVIVVIFIAVGSCEKKETIPEQTILPPQNQETETITPQPEPPSQEQLAIIDYSSKMSEIMQTLTSASTKLGDLTVKYPTGWTDEDMLNAAMQTVILENLYDEVNTLQPPEGLEGAHTLYLQALKKYANAMPLYRNWIDTADSQSSKTAIKLISEGAPLVKEATEMVKKFTSSLKQ